MPDYTQEEIDTIIEQEGILKEAVASMAMACYCRLLNERAQHLYGEAEKITTALKS
jgi:hypothetical protein